MIALTRPNGQPVLLNCDLIESVEEGEGTVIMLTTGNVLVVREKLAEIEARVVAFKRQIYGRREPGA